MLFFKSEHLFAACVRNKHRMFYKYICITVLNTFNHNQCVLILAFTLYTKGKGKRRL